MSDKASSEKYNTAVNIGSFLSVCDCILSVITPLSCGHCLQIKKTKNKLCIIYSGESKVLQYFGNLFVLFFKLQ